MEAYLNTMQKKDLEVICQQFNIRNRKTKKIMINFILDIIKSIPNSDFLSKNFPKEFLTLIRPTEPQFFSCCNSNSQGNHVKCSKCNTRQHVDCVLKNSKLSPYICPDCILKKLSPLEPVAHVLVPAYKFTQLFNNYTLYSISELSFELPKIIDNKVKDGNGSVQIQARCIMDGKSIQQVWPNRGYLLINDKAAMRFEAPANNNAKIRRDVPLNVTRLLNVGKNTVSLVVINDPNTFFLSLVVIQKKTEQEFIDEVIEKNILTVSQSLEFIQKVLCDEDSDVESISYLLPLKCPLSMQIINHPVRGANCRHFSCFDLDTFVPLQNTKINSWKCPKCHNFVYDLVYDEYFKTILDAAAQNNIEGPVNIFPNGEFSLYDSSIIPVKREFDTYEDTFKVRKEAEVIVIDSD